MSYRLAIVETHPIQYKVPWFRRLAEEPGLDVEVFYAMLPDASQQGDGFGVSFEWDLPLLDGYPHRVLENVARRPSVTSFSGCNTPSLHRIISRSPRSSASSAVSSQLSAFHDSSLSVFQPFSISPFSPDFVLVNGWVTRTCIQALVAARRARIPCIVRGEANDIRKRVWWKRVLQGMLVRQYASALYIGQANRDFYLARGVPASRLFFGPYCIDNERFAVAAAAADQQALRKKWSIQENAFCFLFSGKLQPKKRPMDILHALAHLCQVPSKPSSLSGFQDFRISGSRPVHLLIAGDGELRNECESFARDHNLPVSFAGFLNQSELPGAYAVADCLVLPSDSGETWGLVVNEAMACGVPAIVSDQVGCAVDLVTPEKTGFVFPCGDVAGLAVCIQAAVEQGGAMGEACRRRIVDYSYDVLVKGTLAVVEKAKRGKS